MVEDTWSFRERARGHNGRLKPLRIDITTEAGALFDNRPRLKNEALLLDLTIANPCAGSNLGSAARHVGKHLADPVERKKNKYRASFPATYSLLPLAMSTCGEVGSDVHTLIKELAIRRVHHVSEAHSNESQHLAEGTEVARLRRRFSFVLQQAHSFRTRHHLCGPGLALTSTRPLHSQGPVSVQAHRTEGVTRSEGWEGENGVEGGVGVGGGNGDTNGVGGWNGNVNGHGGGDEAGVGTETEVEVKEGVQDGIGDGSGDGAGMGTGTGWRPIDEHRMGTGTGTGTEARTVAEMRTGARITGTGTWIGSRPQNSCSRHVGTGQDLGGNRKKYRKERAVPVAVNPDNL